MSEPSGVTYRNMCETIADAIKDGIYVIRNKHTGERMSATPDAVWNYSPTGELMRIPGWYLEVLEIRRALASADDEPQA